MADRLAYDWDIGPFQRDGQAMRADGTVRGHEVRLLKPVTFMNRSGAALVPLRSESFEPRTDLLVVVDDASLDVGRVRFRSKGSAGGHNGLKSVEASLGTKDYPRLRIGVGAKPPHYDLADWVLSSPPPADRVAIMQTLPELVDCVGIWVVEGTEPAMNSCNRSPPSSAGKEP